jgi:phosphohistidine phosphatase SixA
MHPTFPSASWELESVLVSEAPKAKQTLSPVANKVREGRESV